MIWRDGGLLTFARERACSVLEWALLLCDGDGNGGDGCLRPGLSESQFSCPRKYEVFNRSMWGYE